MTDVTYVPGALTAMVGNGCWALVETSLGAPVIARIWQQLGQGARAEAILAGLLSAGRQAGVQGSATNGAGRVSPGFALLVAGDDGRRRLYCRGAVAATVTEGAQTGGSSIRLDGAGLLTWREHLVAADAERIVLGEQPADSALRLPAADGVVLASCVIVDLAGIGLISSGPPAAVQPAAVPFATGTYPDTVTVTSPGGYVSRVDPSSFPPPGGPAAPSAPRAPEVHRAPAMPRVTGTGDRVAGLLVPPAPSGPPPPAASGGVTSTGTGDGDSDEYDSFWGATQPRSVEDAAVWLADDGDASPGGYGAAPSAAPPWGPPPGMPGAPPPAAAMPRPVRPAPGKGPAGPFPGAGAEAPGPWAPSRLIDAVPWGPDPLVPPEPPAPLTSAHATSAHWTPPLPPSAAPLMVTGPAETDFTIRRDDAAALAARSAPPDSIGPAVPALICPAGHVNPPSEQACRQCAAPLPDDPVIVPRPVLGVLRLSTGDVIALDRGVVMGRSPRADFDGADGAERPHVVKLPSADGDISRTHLRVTLSGWHVLVTDLHSTNGTLVTLPGRDPEQLRPGEPVPIRPGTVVLLAEGIDFRYEVTQ